MSAGKIYTVHEKPEAADPADRVILVREAFSFWALLFNLLWLLSNRLWLASAVYILAMLVINYMAQRAGISAPAVILTQILLQLLVGFSAHDLQRAKLQHQGYREVGVIVAESPAHAQQRYDHYAA